MNIFRTIILANKTINIIYYFITINSCTRLYYFVYLEKVIISIPRVGACSKEKSFRESIQKIYYHLLILVHTKESLFTLLSSYSYSNVLFISCFIKSPKL